LEYSGLGVGTHLAIKASYAGDGVFDPNDSALLTHTVQPNNTLVTLISDDSESAYGQLVVFTALVVPSGGTTLENPGGTVHFYDGDSYIGSATLDANGEASLSYAGLEPGVHSIKAYYVGDGIFTEDWSDPWTQTVLDPP
jgi:hypothetical protein